MPLNAKLKLKIPFTFATKLFNIYLTRNKPFGAKAEN
ncbi:hypothetical protein HDC92_001013 [Pedobacter sp. AK017]|nr:hypothetical protein [Pedobacter sp. AK017]